MLFAAALQRAWIIDPLRLPQDIFTDSGSNVVEEAKSSKEAATEDPEAGSQGEWDASRAEQSQAEQRAEHGGERQGSRTNARLRQSRLRISTRRHQQAPRSRQLEEQSILNNDLVNSRCFSGRCSPKVLTGC